jgi:hypothetical protein
MPTAVSRYAVGGKPSDCRKGPRHAFITYTTARHQGARSLVLLVPFAPARTALPPAVLAVSLAAALPGHGYAQATRAWDAVSLALLERVASAARRLLDAADLLAEVAQAVLATLPPPANGTLYLIADTTIRGKTGPQQPLAHHTRLNQYEPFVFGHSLLLLLAHWGRLRIPVGAVVLDPKRKGQQNIQLRRLLHQFQPPAWCQTVIVMADAGFASKANLSAIQRRG